MAITTAHSDAQRTAIDVFLPWLVESVPELPVDKGSESPLVILDIGSSQGANAIHAMHRLVEAVRRHTDAQAWLFFSDLPTNDFNQVFANLFRDGTSAFAEPDVFTGAVAGSAYKPIVPAHTVHIATSFNMVGWYDSLPDARLSHFIQPNGPKHPSNRASVSAAEKEPFRVQSEIDLRKFLPSAGPRACSRWQAAVAGFWPERPALDDRRTLRRAIRRPAGHSRQRRPAGEVLRRLDHPHLLPLGAELTSPLESDPLLAQAFRIDKVDTREVSVPFNAECAHARATSQRGHAVIPGFFARSPRPTSSSPCPARSTPCRPPKKSISGWSDCSLLIQRTTSFTTSRSRRCLRELDALRNILGAIWVDLVTSVIMD